MKRAGLVGVLGGMGPLATIDFLQKLVALTPAQRDQDHVPTVVWNVPQIPDRQQALRRQGESPLPAMLQGIEQLNQAGASRIVIPCNTAHVWYDALVAHSSAPILHIIDETVAVLQKHSTLPQRIGIVATQGTVEAGLYQQRLVRHGLSYEVNTDKELEQLFTPGCYAVKQNKLQEGAVLLEQAAQALLDRGADHLILACTEVPLALAFIQSRLLEQSLDPNHILAQACVKSWSVESGALTSAE